MHKIRLTRVLFRPCASSTSDRCSGSADQGHMACHTGSYCETLGSRAINDYRNARAVPKGCHPVHGVVSAREVGMVGRLDGETDIRVYNILEGRKEVERVLYRKDDPKEGFILLPDLKWDETSINAMVSRTLARLTIVYIGDCLASRCTIVAGSWKGAHQHAQSNSESGQKGCAGKVRCAGRSAANVHPLPTELL